MSSAYGSYEGIVSETYDIWFSGELFFDTNFYKRLMDEIPGMALEIGCGTGRLLLPYLAEGYEVEGVDCSKEMLSICEYKAKAKELSPVLYDQQMQELNLPKKYKTIFVPLASFMCVTDREEAMLALQNMYAHLEEGGQVVIPLFIPPNENKQEWTVGRRGTRSDGAEIILSSVSSVQFHEQVQTKLDRYEVVKDNVLAETKFSTTKLRWYYKYEFMMMLEKAGFRDITIYGGYDFQQMTDDQTFMIFRARK
ncbi:class I SAM-dependent DNA methyltransferase [Paenibacillus gorillae]|uniref:class I SAM-dependent DNA methyltransferase n=1 Tax=Paenibacillus gorillae TaxID=1243662 RepID=UPI0004B67564|nr:class I SAM-dependent methyltransferase [Paenibacillus gorillae]